jgi:hypothetical protein
MIVRKYTVSGKVIRHLKQWKIDNPGEMVFDSKFELNCYKVFKQSGFKFDFQVEARELLPAIKAVGLNSGKAKPKLFIKNIAAATYTMDFLIYCNDGTRMFIESKGFMRPVDQLRIKMFRHTLSKGEVLVVLKQKTAVRDLAGIVNIINEHHKGSGTSYDVINMNSNG